MTIVSDSEKFFVKLLGVALALYHMLLSCALAIYIVYRFFGCPKRSKGNLFDFGWLIDNVALRGTESYESLIYCIVFF